MPRRISLKCAEFEGGFEIVIPNWEVWSLKQFYRGIPKAILEINNLIPNDFDAFLFQSLLHGIRRFKVVLPGEQALAVNNPVSGNIFFSVCRVHRPAHHTGTHPGAKISGNCPITGDPSFRDQPGYRMHIFEEVMGSRVLLARCFIILFQRFAIESDGF
jgi:hypothetical protein